MSGILRTQQLTYYTLPNRTTQHYEAEHYQTQHYRTAHIRRYNTSGLTYCLLVSLACKILAISGCLFRDNDSVRCALEDLYCSIGLSTRLWAFLPSIYMNYPGRYPAFSPLGFQPCSRRGVLPTDSQQEIRAWKILAITGCLIPVISPSWRY